MEQIIIKNLSVGYGKKEILSNVNFTIEKGDYLCIVGENGAGKSTLMKTILNLHEKMSGEIIKNINTTIGYLPQQNQIKEDFPCSCFEIVLSGFEKKKGFRPFYNKSEKDEAMKNMQLLQIYDFKSRNFSELSGGQKQKVLLARAISATKEIIFLDEMTNSLDNKSTNDIYALLKKLNEKIDDQNVGTTIVMITHDKDAIKYCNKVLYIGKNLQILSRDEYLKNYSAKLNTVSGGQNE